MMPQGLEKHILDLKHIFQPEASVEFEVEAVAERGDGGPPESEVHYGENDSAAAFWEKLGRRALFALLFLTPIFFLPLTAVPVDINKQALVLALTILALVSFLAAVLLRRRFSYPHDWVARAFLTVVLITGASTLFSRAPGVSLYGNLIQPDAFLVILAGSVLYALAAHFFRREDLPTIAMLFFGGVLVTAAIELLQVFGRFIFPWDFAQQTSWNTMNSAFGVGALMTAAIAVIASLPLERFARRGRIILLAIGAFLLGGLFIINYQILWVLLAVMMILVAAIRFAANGRLGLPLTMVVIAFFFAIVSRYLPVVAEVPFEVRTNFGTTVAVAREALSGWRLVLGTGPGTFGLDYSLYRPIESNQSNFWSFRFNQGFGFLPTTLGTTGLLGFLAFAALIVVFIRQALRRFDDPAVVVIAMPLFFFALTMVFYPLSLAQYVYFALGLGLLCVLSSPGREVSLRHLPRWQSFASFVCIIFLIAASLSALYVVGRKYLGAVAYARALTSLNAGHTDASLETMNRVVSLDPDTDEYWRSGSQMLLVKAREILNQPGRLDNARQIQIQTVLSNAVQSAERATRVNPVDALNWSNLGNVYENLVSIVSGADVPAKANYKRALELDPKNPQLHVNIARTLVAAADAIADRRSKTWQDRLAEARTALERATSLKADYGPAHFLLAQVFIREGNVSLAIQKTEEIKAANPLDAGIAFQLGLLYYQASEFDQAQLELERAVALNADYSNARYFLGLVYDRKGMKSRAVEQFQRIAKLNPENAEVAAILQNLLGGKPALRGIVPPPETRTDAPVSEERTP